MEQLRTDVLVIGSGGAGMRAAMAASEAGADVLVLSKGKCGLSGATVTASADVNCDSRSILDVLGYDGDPDDTMEAFFEDTVSGGKYLNDARLVETLVTDAPARVKELIDWGARVKRVYQTPGHRTKRGLWVDGRNYAMTVLKQMRKHPVKTRDNCAVIDLAVKDGQVCGAYAVDLETGEYLVVSAKAVVLASGGAMNIFNVSTACTELYGDGQAMALRAGAALTDMEFPMYLLGCGGPPAAEGMNFTFAIMNQCGAHLLNRLGQRYMQKWDPERMEHSTRDTLIVAATTEILEGRGSPNGGVWVSLRHLPRGLIDHFFEWYGEWTDMPSDQYECFKIADLFPDLDGGGIEARPSAHYWNGGVVIDRDGRTTLPGLFAAGEVTGGVHGANRLSGNAMLEILVFGERSGKAAAAFAKSERAPTPDDNCNAFDFSESLFADGTPDESVLDIRKRLTATAWEVIGPVRTEAGLKKANDIATDVKEKLPSLRLAHKGRVFNREWMDAMSLRSIADMFRMSSEAGLLRTESRGSHFRREFPESDEAAWRKNIILTERNGSIECAVTPVHAKKGGTA
ncbi:FAD-binding protein [Oscillospiraceae bacterium OttesenSCG-928-G22]|nr:FAD-binding protein [Oscillospiraceae bacterium OttesenSCG-928-G22]